MLSPFSTTCPWSIPDPKALRDFWTLGGQLTTSEQLPGLVPEDPVGEVRSRRKEPGWAMRRPSPLSLLSPHACTSEWAPGQSRSSGWGRGGGGAPSPQPGLKSQEG